nr:microtubule-associated protein futsch-like [Ipomoea batatas]GMD35102.1 microtubule-associated protein futsch-like [Ipomoea batatas]
MLAFGAAIFGVMILHKLRERRIYNLLVQEKDHQLHSLQLLLQKEKDNAKDAKRQVEETKAKMQKLRTKKLDLETAILEMESTISSLREEQRTIASTLEEKQNEIKVLMDRNRGGENRESARFSALSEALRQKEAEIEELKQRVESPVKVWSVSADDPSNLPINLTAKAAGKLSDADADAGSNENINNNNGGETGAQTEVSGKQYHKKEDSQEVSSNTSMGNTINRSEVRTVIGDQARNIVNSESNGVMKLGKAYSSEILGRRTRGKRRRISITNRGGSEISLMKSETEGVDSMRSRKPFTESRESERDKRTEDGRERRNEYTLEDPKAELPNRIDAETVKSNLNRNNIDAITAANEKSAADTGDKRGRIDNGETEQQMDEGQEIKVTSTEYEKSPSNLQNMPANSTVYEDSRLLNKTENEKSEENGQPEVTNTLRDNKDTEDHEASRITERDLKEDDPEVEDDQETETEIDTEAVTSRNSTSDAEEDDETEF